MWKHMWCAQWICFSTNLWFGKPQLFLFKCLERSITEGPYCHTTWRVFYSLGHALGTYLIQKSESLSQPRKPRRSASCYEAPRYSHVNLYSASILEDKPALEAYFEMQRIRKRCGQFHCIREGQNGTTTLFSKDCLLLKVQLSGDVGGPSSLLSRLPCSLELGRPLCRLQCCELPHKPYSSYFLKRLYPLQE